jgi:hypothetical protein
VVVVRDIDSLVIGRRITGRSSGVTITTGTQSEAHIRVPSFALNVTANSALVGQNEGGTLKDKLWVKLAEFQTSVFEKGKTFLQSTRESSCIFFASRGSFLSSEDLEYQLAGPVSAYTNWQITQSVEPLERTRKKANTATSTSI